MTVEATRPLLLIYAPAAHAEHASILVMGWPLAFKFTEQMVDSELPSPNPRRSELSNHSQRQNFPRNL